MNIAPYIISRGNWLSMADFMDTALFDPEGGYYSNNIPLIGQRGDFSTCATQSTLLARRLVAAWESCCKACGRRLPFLEIGGGSGDMMLNISRELGFFGRMRTRYIMVERSERLRGIQKTIGGGFVRTFETIEKALKSCNGGAFIFSNELPDAFAARQFVFQEGEWYELGLSCNEGKIFRQAWKRPLPKSSAFERWAQEGQVIEVHESYHQWYASWQQLWKQGCFTTIDYGDVNELLYYRRPTGSMRGYKAHQLLNVDELPALAGACDITCDVNFTDLKALAESCVGDQVELMNQAEYLQHLALPDDEGDQHLIRCPGAGDHFKVLVQFRA